MSGSGFNFRLWERSCAAALCVVLTPYGFGQVQSTTPAPEAPQATAPAQPAATSIAQQAQQAQQQQTQPVTAPPMPFHVELPHSRNPFFPYMPSTVPPINLTNSSRLQNLERDGKLYISLRDAIALALENNLDIAYFRYNFPTAEADLQRTKAGGVRSKSVV